MNITIGYKSTGHCSTGDKSTGDWSTGHSSTGEHSTGDYSTGDRSTGRWSTGDRSTGNWSTGDWSTGDRSTGNWSISDRSTGDFSIADGAYKMFDETCSEEEYRANRPDWLYFSPLKWIKSTDMTEKEKKDNPAHLTTRGYLKKLSFKEAAFQSWEKTTQSDRKDTLKLTNFNDEIFKTIFGFSAVDFIQKETQNEII